MVLYSIFNAIFFYEIYTLHNTGLRYKGVSFSVGDKYSPDLYCLNKTTSANNVSQPSTTYYT